jgi:vacuolar-type H+-ATPase subunit B/Vma2
MIFKRGSCAEELFDGMQDAQQQALVEESQQHDQLVFAAMQALNNAAESFERVGRTARAEEVTAVMVSLAEDKPKANTKSSKDEAADTFKFFGFKPKDLGLADDDD